MKTLSLLLISLLLTACAKNNSDECHWPAATRIATAHDSRPKILVIGDSISVGYAPEMQRTLSAYDVIHIPCNPPDSNDHVTYIEEWLSISPSFAAVTFNSGIHDATYRYNVSDAQYEANMRVIARKIQAKTPNGLFLTSTEILAGTAGIPAGRDTQLNAIATTVMTQESMPLFDLYAFSQSIPDEHKNSTDVHYTAQGYRDLAAAINAELNNRFGIH